MDDIDADARPYEHPYYWGAFMVPARPRGRGCRPVSGSRCRPGFDAERRAGAGGGCHSRAFPGFRGLQDQNALSMAAMPASKSIEV